MGMQQLALTPLLNRKWKQVAIRMPRGGYKWAPPVEIRTHLEGPSVETWFHVFSDGPVLQRYSAMSTTHMLSRWRIFLTKCQSYAVESRDGSFFGEMFGKCILEDNIWTDDQERYVGNLQLVQGGGGLGPQDLRIRLSSHSSSADFESFQAWLDMLDELHKPFLEAQQAQPE
jgi:hypothetical protein